MTAPDLSELESLLAKATPGPWRASIKHGHYICDAGGWITAECGNSTRPGAYADNAALIVAAVNALPALIARVRELERENDALGNEAETMRLRAEAAESELKEARYDNDRAWERRGALAMRERCAEVCAELATAYFDEYKGRFPFPERGENRANPHREGMSDGASACAAEIRELEP